METTVRELRKTIAKRIKELRQIAGLTQEDLAEKADMAPETLSRYETGRQFPSLALAIKLANALNATVPSLLTESHDNAEAERFSRIAALFSTVNESDAAFLEARLVEWLSHLKQRSE